MLTSSVPAGGSKTMADRWPKGIRPLLRSLRRSIPRVTRRLVGQCEYAYIDESAVGVHELFLMAAS